MSRPNPIRMRSVPALLVASLITALLGVTACAASHVDDEAAPPAQAAPAAKAAPAPAAAAAATAQDAPTQDAGAADGGSGDSDEAAASSGKAGAAAVDDGAADGKAGEEAKQVPRVVELSISGNVAEDPSPENPLGPSRRNFRGKLMLLRQLASDPNVAGVRLELNGTPDFAHVIDLLEELRRVKAAGKSIVCYAETLDQRDLMVASVADHLVVPPSGLIALEGLTAELMYLKDLFDKLDVRFEVLHVGEYKTAYEDFAKNQMSEEQREVIGVLLDEFYDQMLDTIAEQRGMDRAALEGLYAQVFVTPEAARAAGLIDAVAFADEFDAQVEERFGEGYELVENYGDKSKEDIEKMLASPFAAFSLLPKLLNPPKKVAPDEPHVAIVYCTGVITSGDSRAGWDGTVSSMGSDTIVKALEQTLDDENVKAVILRVNSPGGSALASDMIWRAIQRVKEEKPVIASMGNVAGSGGYWISMGCSAIVAQPSTITGSMGVVAMVPDVSLALKDLGVNVQTVSKGPHGDALSILAHGASPVLKDALGRMMHDVYEDFLEKASAGRRMEKDRVAELAKGRVWSGRQAEELGLVDQLGGLADAVALACVMGGGLDPAKTPIMEYPQAPSFMEALEKSFEDMAMTEAFVPDPLRTLLRHPALAPYATLATDMLTETRALHADRVQCLLPFVLTVR